MTAELGVIIQCEVTGLGTDISARNKKIDSETPTKVVRTTRYIPSETILSVLTQVATSLTLGLYVKAVSGEVCAAVVSTTALVSLKGYRLQEGESMFVPVCSEVDGETYYIALTGSATTVQAEIVQTQRAS